MNRDVPAPGTRTPASVQENESQLNQGPASGNSNFKIQISEIPDHQILRRIGSGSYGEVWIALNALGTLRAVKIVRRHTFTKDEHYEREFRGLQKYEPISRSHPGLIHILHLGRNEKDGYFYYIMELADTLAEGASSLRTHSGPANDECSPVVLAGKYVPCTLRQVLNIRGALPLQECLSIAMTLACALEHLHKHHLIHRDVKPSNIVFVNGVPKLADIGLVIEASEAKSYVGTDGYIPPEGPGTPQADIYSFGKVLYELCTGKDRFEFPALPLNLLESRERLEFGEINDIIVRACAARVRDRYRSAEALRDDIEYLQQGRSVSNRHQFRAALQIAAMTLGVALLLAGLISLLPNRIPEKTLSVATALGDSAPDTLRTASKFVAVIPFNTITNAETEQLLGSQFAEELTRALSKYHDLRVLGELSAGMLKQSKDRLLAARDLRLDALVEGTIRKAGNRVQLTAQLVSTLDGHSMWSSDELDREMREIISIPEELAGKLAMALQIAPRTASVHLGRPPAVNLAAYDLYWLGRKYWDTRTQTGVAKAIEYFQEAIKQDPAYALAYSGLADCYGYFRTELSPKDKWSKAKEYATRAVQIDNNLSEAHASLGLVQENFDWNWKGAETCFKRALELNPNNATVLSWYAFHLARTRQYEEAVQTAKRAQALDPLAPIRTSVLASMLTAARRYDDAIIECRRFLSLNPQYFPPEDIESCFFYKGLYAEGIAIAEKIASQSERPNAIQQVAFRQAFEQGGAEGYWRKRLELRLNEWNEGMDRVPVAVIYAWLGDYEQALHWLEQGLEERSALLDKGFEGSWRLKNLNLMPVFEPLRPNPRFQNVLQKMGWDIEQDSKTL
ncbi:MAG: protein kinase [Verrucomicrobiota bacterium]